MQRSGAGGKLQQQPSQSRQQVKGQDVPVESRGGSSQGEAGEDEEMEDQAGEGHAHITICSS